MELSNCSTQYFPGKLKTYIYLHKFMYLSVHNTMIGNEQKSESTNIHSAE
jgi:hypothetical protein